MYNKAEKMIRDLDGNRRFNSPPLHGDAVIWMWGAINAMIDMLVPYYDGRGKDIVSSIYDLPEDIRGQIDRRANELR